MHAAHAHVVILACVHQRTASTLSPLGYQSCKKAQAVSFSFTQRKAHMDHPQRISQLLVAILNAIHNQVTTPGRLKKKDEKF